MDHAPELLQTFTPVAGIRLDIDTLRTIFAITDDDVDAMKVAWRLMDPVLPDLIATFYEHPYVASYFAGFEASRIGALKGKQLEHWKQLFNSNFDEHYLRRTRRAAIAHRVLGIQASTYIVAYRIFVTIVLQELRQGFSLRGDVLERLTAAITKIVAADVAITVHAYESELLGD